ncbi:L,D-transpeptidase [Rhodopseudomonas pseudopalustris]|uniref:L,D-transpeptidase catalytic domain n=1 Tax=Rhodopseudomonas pseudopalustris TaxID=1513892 RepID=A0A1H8QCS8_9BRAD|nr:L,D-transpeptidase [Rhodopseudomonas pseudopalustris]SEO52019.1 L,D-transpeptidase catalytic domain [Rhodopseudomonas pseudopalustris]
MRSYLVSLTGLILLAASTAQAKVAITVDKDNQEMTVAVDGVERYRWPVSTGNPSHETPNGSFRTFRMEADHYSKEFDDAPMPHAIFFTRQGHAIHGTDAAGKLGVPVSHGCIRLSRDNASTLYALVEKDGVLNTTVNLTGSSRVALAKQPGNKANTAVARRAPAPSYDGAGEPVELAPRAQPRVARPQVADDGFIYPADGNDGRRYPAPPGYRRGYAQQQYQPQYQYQYSEDDSYAAQVYAPRRSYQPRGYYGGYSDD